MSFIFSLTCRQGAAKLHTLCYNLLNISRHAQQLRCQPTSSSATHILAMAPTSFSKLRSCGYINVREHGRTPVPNSIHQYISPFQNKWINGCNTHVTNFVHTNAVKNSEKSLALVHVLKEIRFSPAPALILGLSGLIPFVAAPCYFLSGGAFVHDLAIAQLAYGASILSFLGGVRWGFTLPNAVSHELTWRNLGWSVTPSLLAWSALLMPYTFGSLTLITGLGGAAYLDLMYKAYPTWFKALRFCLSLIAMLSLWTSLVLSFVLKEQ